MVTAETLAARAAAIRGSADLQALLAHLRDRARPLLERMPIVPEHKALLTTDGGFCPDDGVALTFDPWSPTAHRCPRCGKTSGSATTGAGRGISTSGSPSGPCTSRRWRV